MCAFRTVFNNTHLLNIIHCYIDPDPVCLAICNKLGNTEDSCTFDIFEYKISDTLRGIRKSYAHSDIGIRRYNGDILVDQTFSVNINNYTLWFIVLHGYTFMYNKYRSGEGVYFNTTKYGWWAQLENNKVVTTKYYNDVVVQRCIKGPITVTLDYTNGHITRRTRRFPDTSTVTCNYDLRGRKHGVCVHKDSFGSIVAQVEYHCGRIKDLCKHKQPVKTTRSSVLWCI